MKNNRIEKMNIFMCNDWWKHFECSVKIVHETKKWWKTLEKYENSQENQNKTAVTSSVGERREEKAAQQRFERK